MPPKSPKLADAVLNQLRGWIDGGALENAGSKPVMRRKKSVQLALPDSATGKPEKPAMPGRLVIEPVVRTSRTTAVRAMATSPWAPLVAVGQRTVGGETVMADLASTEQQRLVEER